MLMVMILTDREMMITPLEELRCYSLEGLKHLKAKLGWHDRNVILFDSGYHTPFHLDAIHYQFSEEETIMMFGNRMRRKPMFDHAGTVNSTEELVQTSTIPGRGVRVLA